MSRRRMARFIALAGGAALATTALFSCGSGAEAEPARALPTMPAAFVDTPYVAPAFAPEALRAPAPADAEVDAAYDRAARAAWAFVERHASATTGLVAAQPTWAYPTVWDIASSLAAYHSAHLLGYIERADYAARVGRVLDTLERARLYHDVAYGRNYDYRTGELVGHDQEPSQNGTGYSAIDLGRLLVWLKIVATDVPELAGQAERVASRLDASHILRDGYMHGESLTEEDSVLAFQEGRIGYEQYAATGFALWGMNAGNALDASRNAGSTTVLGVPITTDNRRLDRLTSEPFVLAGLELGWSDAMARMAWQTLAAQARRFEETGQITIASEDAIARPPYYFYYYCVYCSGEAFTINVHAPGTRLDEPRWISTKAAFGWHALLPSGYTWQAVQAVQPALDPEQGWASGVFEGSGESTATWALNNSAVILEAAAYRRIRSPFLLAARTRTQE
ncbi:MAG TPA: DUF3131 domain-containing protein [Longimicrobiales bacterium]